jgi:hypothetical protein
MGEHALTVKVVRDGPDRALIVCGDLDFTQTGGLRTAGNPGPGHDPRDGPGPGRPASRNLVRREPEPRSRPREVTQVSDGTPSFKVVRGVPVVAAPEAIDIASASALRSALVEAAAHGHGTLVVDMALTRFCDSSEIIPYWRHTGAPGLKAGLTFDPGGKELTGKR